MHWKLAYITHVHKGHGAREDLLSSDRPIAYTSIVCRTFEHVLNAKIHAHLETHGLLSPAQDGFRRNRSCETARGFLVNIARAHLDERTPYELIQLDMPPAFDRVQHPALLGSIEAKVISGTVLSLTSSFLSNRTQRVTYRGVASSRRAVLAGISEGSVLGPTLSTIYIDSITQNVTSIPFLYADDIALLQPIHKPSDYVSFKLTLTLVISELSDTNFLSAATNRVQ
ncbi:hypothetical protein HPB49_019688 [Dermacentor silvarum]|uniref:Uncharacterized protein n=1 Tax=Dermacentor silvarum TaxID=543639 RepID=A0ACB8CSW7_DERSI|nr:hypothetical protein HPB49_019688 [Dermacentor silvarum]